MAQTHKDLRQMKSRGEKLSKEERRRRNTLAAAKCRRNKDIKYKELAARFAALEKSYAALFKCYLDVTQPSYNLLNSNENFLVRPM